MSNMSKGIMELKQIKIEKEGQDKMVISRYEKQGYDRGGRTKISFDKIEYDGVGQDMIGQGVGMC